MKGFKFLVRKNPVLFLHIHLKKPRQFLACDAFNFYSFMSKHECYNFMDTAKLDFKNFKLSYICILLQGQVPATRMVTHHVTGVTATRTVGWGLILALEPARPTGPSCLTQQAASATTGPW